jgi:hypothetical protein
MDVQNVNVQDTKKIERPCFICKEYMSLENDNVVCDKKNNQNQYKHFDCFVLKEFNKRGNKLSLEQIKENVLKVQKENEFYIRKMILKDKFWYWIQDVYGIVSIPSYFFVKVDSVVNGGYKGLSINIPMEHLFDMWKRKKQELDKIAMNNVKKGNGINDVGRLDYDLAVLVGKYDSYLKWLEKNKIMEQDEQENKELLKNKIDLSKININNNINNKNNELDIINLIDEI